jgi:hypothetical protein
MRDGFSAAIVTVTGEFTPAQVAQIEALARHQEKAEMAEHPLNRIMAIERPSGVTMIITTTDLHLPRPYRPSAQKSLRGGRLDEHFEKDGDTVRIASQTD